MSDNPLDSMSDEEFLKQTVPTLDTEIEDTPETPDTEPPPQEEITDAPDDLEFPEDFDFQAEYKKLCKPFKANGQVVAIRDADEIISLMQKGIGYTAKSQKLQEQVRVASMIENAQIDKAQLALLIDASKKNPKALQRLVKESNIDPLDLDMSEDSEYSPTNYEVSDEEIQFKNTLEELNQTESGKTLLAGVKDWDTTSKDTIWKQPNLLNVLAEQVESGVYDVITKEITRRKLVGTVDSKTSFLQAYHEVGNQLLEQRSKAKDTDTQVAKVGKTIVDKRVNTPKPTLANHDKVLAASSNSKSQSTGKTVMNPLLMSDDDFMKLQNPNY